MAQVSVTIGGKTFRMACDDGQEDHLRELAQYFDEALAQLKEGFGEIGDQRLTTMAGLMICDRLFEAERKLKGVEAELETLRDTRTSVIDRSQERERVAAKAISKAAGQIADIAKKLDGLPSS